MDHDDTVWNFVEIDDPERVFSLAATDGLSPSELVEVTELLPLVLVAQTYAMATKSPEYQRIVQANLAFEQRLGSALANPPAVDTVVSSSDQAVLSQVQSLGEYVAATISNTDLEPIEVGSSTWRILAGAHFVNACRTVTVKQSQGEAVFTAFEHDVPELPTRYEQADAPLLLLLKDHLRWSNNRITALYRLLAQEQLIREERIDPERAPLDDEYAMHEWTNHFSGLAESGSVANLKLDPNEKFADAEVDQGLWWWLKDPRFVSQLDGVNTLDRLQALPPELIGPQAHRIGAERVAILTQPLLDEVFDVLADALNQRVFQPARWAVAASRGVLSRQATALGFSMQLAELAQDTLD